MPVLSRPLFSCASLLPQLAVSSAPGDVIALGPITLQRSALGIARSAGLALATVVLAVILLRLVPVLERFVINRAKKNIAAPKDESVPEHTQRIETLTRVTGSVARALIWAVTIMVLLGTVGLSVTPLLAGAGIAGVAVGFGAQSIVKDFFAGFFILLENQFSVGDTVTIAGVTGTVEQMTLRITMLRDANGTAYFIPNSSITTVANKTLGWVRVMLDASFSAGVPEETARAALEASAKRIDAMADMKGALLEPVTVEGPIELTAGAVIYRLVAKADVDHPVEVRRSLISGLQAELLTRGLGYDTGVIVERPRTSE